MAGITEKERREEESAPLRENFDGSLEEENLGLLWARIICFAKVPISANKRLTAAVALQH